MDKTAATALFAWIDRELWLITAQSGDRRGALIATFVNQASIVPDLPRVVVGIARHHYTWKLIEESGTFALHLLGQMNAEWVGHFGMNTGHEVDKLEGWDYARGTLGNPMLPGAVGWLDCRVETKMDSGDRTLYLAEVVESHITNYGPPLTLKHFLSGASKEQLTELKRLMHLDSTLDMQAIIAWRAERGIHTEIPE